MAQQYPFVHYTPKDGLVNNRVRSAIQDSRGRIYFSTYGGLSVYDGSRFTNYTTEDGLGANNVNDIVEMGIDSIWVLTNSNKINYLIHGILKEFITADKFCPTINRLIKCSDGFYYALADDGLYRFQNNRFIRMDVRDKNGIEINSYFVQGEEIDNKLFLLTDASVATYPAPSYLIVYDIRTGEAFINNRPNNIGWVIKTPQNEILVTTSEGLKIINKPGLRKQEIIFNPVPPIYRSAEKIVGHHLYFDREAALWVLYQKGIYKIDKLGNGKLFSTKNGLPVSAYTDVFQDKENSIWFLNDQTGLSKLTYPSYELQTFADTGFHVTDMYADQTSDSVWFLDHSLQKIMVKHPGGSKMFTIQNKSPITKIHYGNGKANFLMGDFAVYKYEVTAASDKIIPQLIFKLPDSINGVVYALSDDSGNLVFSSNQINVVSPDKKVVQYPLGYFADQFVISGNRLWVATRANKLFAFQLHPENFQNYFELLKTYDKELPKFGPRSITIDKKGNVWVGTRDQGLFCFFIDQKMNITSWQQFTMKDGLSDNFIFRLHCDSSGTIWACSYAGLDKVQEINKSFKIVNITKGNNFYQFVFKVQTTKKGVVWASSRTGIIKIDPVPEVVKKYQAKILFTQIKVGKTKINPLDKLSFSYKENDISFQMSAPTYIDEKQTRFSYRLKGSINNEWSEPSAEPDIRYINLGPGRYTLHVKAGFLTGVYPDTETSYDFEILPPWWQTWWFKSLMVLASISLLILIIRSYFKNKLEKQRKALEKQQAIEKERSRIALDMHDDLGAGLSTIRFLSEKVRRNIFSDITKTDIDKMVNTSNELVENMNEIIWAMNEKNDTLEDLLFYTRSYAKEYCEENQLDCIVHFPEKIPTLFVSGELRRNVFLTVKESLHNIVKHAEATKVVIEISINNELIVAIKDNGRGFSTGDHTTISGGNGLKNMKKRVESIGGNFISENGRGVTITIEVPLPKL